MKRQTEIEKFFSQLLFHTHVSIAQSTPGPNDEGGPLALKVKKRKMGWLGSFQDPEGLGIKDGEEGKSTYPLVQILRQAKAKLGRGWRVEPGEHYSDNSLKPLCGFALEDLPLAILSGPQ